MFADDLYTINISLDCIIRSGLGKKDISVVLKSDEVLRYAVDSQAFLEEVYILYMYFNTAWLTTLTKNVGHSAIYNLSFKLLFVWLQENFSRAATWNFTPQVFLVKFNFKSFRALYSF